MGQQGQNNFGNLYGKPYQNWYNKTPRAMPVGGAPGGAPGSRPNEPMQPLRPMPPGMPPMDPLQELSKGGGSIPNEPMQRPNFGGSIPNEPMQRPNLGGSFPNEPMQRPSLGGSAPFEPMQRPNVGLGNPQASVSPGTGGMNAFGLPGGPTSAQGAMGGQGPMGGQGGQGSIPNEPNIPPNFNPNNPPPGWKGPPTSPPTPGPSPLPNQQVAPLTPQQLEAMWMTGQQAGGSQGYLNQAMAEQQGILGGAGLSPNNPYLAQYFKAASDPMIQQYQQATAPNILANAAQTGTLGGSGMNQAFGNANTSLAQGLGNLAAGIYEPAYQQGVDIQQQAAQGAPGLAQGQFIPSQELFQSGQIGQNQGQNVLQAAYNNLYQKAMWPYQELGMLGGALGQAGGGGGTTITTGPSPYQPSMK